ncbi:Phage protein [Yersinia phage fPS-90]|uniref:Phage protein n=1 Tax=Yersinia phage fPS-90 TaxID=2052932 RepID=A0A449C3L7_9CAUD|nr:Phage protein [Yersinia phage fPS-90]VEV88947.1 Phage protein [Yersinia phage fPS-90]
MKRLVLEVSPLFGELAIEKVNNMYRLTQEDDMLYFTPSEIVLV